MAAPSRRASAPLIEQLLQEPYRFRFFQAVRVLERAASRLAGEAAGRKPVGQDYAPRDEVLHFQVLPSHTFPPCDILSLTPGEPRADNQPGPYQMMVSFLGMTGPSGVLPQHYTQLVIDRIRKKDHALRDFLDIFNHRFVSLFYRAWRKYRFYVGYERARSEQQAGEEDLYTACLYCLIGLGTGSLRSRQEILDETLLYYGGHFAHFPRTAIALETMLQDYFQLRVVVIQFLGQWLYLNVLDQSRCSPREGSNNQLGCNVVVGEKVWGVEQTFRLRLGPLRYAQFARFSPGGDLLRELCQLVRTYAGPEFTFDVQLVLLAAEVPPCQLGGEGREVSRLGWNTWLSSKPFTQDVQDAVFVNEGAPTR